MRIHLVFVGKTGFSDLESAIARYVDRIAHYCHIQTHYIKPEKIASSSNEDTVRARESDRILKLVPSQGHLIVLDRSGREYDSPGLARFMEKLNDSGVSDVWMVIGGPVGVSAELLKRADTLMSLSKLTFPHDLARLVVAEQLYRAFTIIRGEPYHK
jgi:23S rRNA (pseudouridine1915-N3)-methyltransferase